MFGRRLVPAIDQIQIATTYKGTLEFQGGHYCRAFSVMPTNFALRNEDEQDAIIDAFQHFLNGIHTPMQILIRVRRLNVEQYLDSFAGLADTSHQAQANQLEDYRSFVRELVEDRSLLSRHYYVALSTSLKKNTITVAHDQLTASESAARHGLERMGLKTTTLGSSEMIALFYELYQPRRSETQPLHAQIFNKRSSHAS